MPALPLMLGRRTTARALAGLAALLAFGCGAGETGPKAPARFERPRLEVADASARPRAQVEVYAHQDALAERGAWTFSAERVRVYETELTTPAGAEFAPHVELIAEDGAPDVAVERAGDFDLARFDQVHVRLTFAGSSSLRAELWRGDELVGQSSTAALLADRGVQSLALDLPRELASAGRADRLVLRLSGGLRRARLYSADLLRRPAETRLPDPARSPELVWLDGEGRRGVGLAFGRALAARFEVPADGALAPVLSFSVGEPAEVARAGRALAVRVTVEGGGKRKSARFDVPQDASWRSARVELGELAGASATARFELEVARSDGSASGAEGDAACALAELALWTRGSAPPPVLLVTSDTHRGDHLGLAPNGAGVATPVLDALAARGAYFERCFTWTNSTNPSHAALLTGRHPRDTGILTNRQHLQDAAPTLAEAFRDAGYATWASVSAPHLLHPTSGLGQGFDRMVGPVLTLDRPAAETVDDVARWLDDLGARPLFLWVHLFDAHWPYTPPKEFERRYPPAHPTGEGARWPAALADGPQAREGGVDELRARYKAEVSYLDAELGRLFGLPALDGALVGVVGDHGESLGAHGMWFGHGGLYPDSLHVPLVVALPGAPGGQRSAALVAQGDLGRTLLDLAGLEGAPFPGSDLRRHLLGEHASEVHFALHANGVSASVTQGDWHLILTLAEWSDDEGHAQPRHGVQLFDLGADPGCTRDLAESEERRAREMRAGLVRWIESAEVLGWESMSEVDGELDEQLRALGYVDTTTVGARELWVPDACPQCKRWR